MAPVATPAIVLHSIRYSETSKIVRLATRELGVQSAIAKGALRKKSPFGGGLELLSEGVAQLAHREQRELQTLTAFDVTVMRTPLARDLPRFAAGSVLAEVMLRVAPPAPLPQAFDLLRAYLDLLMTAPPEAVEAVALRAVWRLVGALGFAPRLDACARDALPLGDGRRGVAFSVADGGALCPSCARLAGTDGKPLKPEDWKDLEELTAKDGEIREFDARHAAAHRRLVGRWIRHHVGGNRAFPALDWWEQRPWAAAS